MRTAEKLTGGWEPAAPAEDSVLRQFACAYANRVAWMAGVAGGEVDRDPLARAAASPDALRFAASDDSSDVWPPGGGMVNRMRKGRVRTAARHGRCAGGAGGRCGLTPHGREDLATEGEGHGNAHHR